MHAACPHTGNILAYTLIVELIGHIHQITHQKQSTHQLLQTFFRHQFMIHYFKESHSHELDIQNLPQDYLTTKLVLHSLSTVQALLDLLVQSDLYLLYSLT